ncbi:uncharacterized protein LOC113006024, partial [Solenopsis invicta]|uniref:uncharacterized protein LOC113006024 n=1 Tax=Solenopsis invicta TaxID=13686 RepID=UPI00193E2A2E
NISCQLPETDVVNNETCAAVHNVNSQVHRSTSISPDRIFNSPTKVLMRKIHREEVKSLKRKLHVINYIHKKAKKKIRDLKTVLKELQKRNLITEDEGDILQHLNEGTKELVKRDIRKKKLLPIAKKYPPKLRQFALSQ